MGRRGGPGRRGYPAELRRRVVDLLATGRKVADVARDLGVSEQAIYGWRRQERIDRGLEAGVSTLERASWPRPSGESASWRRSWPCTGVRPSC